MERDATWKQYAEDDECEDDDVETEDVMDDIPTFVIPGLYVGSIDAARNTAALKSKGITHVVRCCCDEDVLTVGYDPASDPPNTLVLQWYDDVSTEILVSGELETALDHLRQSIICESGAVLVHCIAGRSRSVTVVLAWLIVNRGMSFADALLAVQGARPWVDPNMGFVNQIQALSAKFSAAVEALRMATGSPVASSVPVLRWLPTLAFAPQFIDMIRNGTKCATTRLLGAKDTDLVSEKASLAVGTPCRAVTDGKDFALLRVVRFEDRLFADVDDDLARIENMQSAAELKAVLRHFYPGAADDDHIRVIYFSVFLNS